MPSQSGGTQRRSQTFAGFLRMPCSTVFSGCPRVLVGNPSATICAPSLIRAAPAALSFPTGSLMERLVALLPTNLARDHRDDLISEIALAIYEGRVPEAHLEGHVMALIRRAFKTDHNPWGDVSLDTVIPGTELLRINIVSEGLWA